MKTIPSRSASQSGYALLLALIALLVLTLLGVVSLQAAQSSLAISANQRRHVQLGYAAVTGLDHTRVILENPAKDVPGLAAQAAASPGRCLEHFISAASEAETAPEPLQAGGVVLGSYSVELCWPICSRMLSGTMLNASDSGQNTVALSMQVASVGHAPGSTNSVEVGGTLVGRVTGEDCNGF